MSAAAHSDLRDKIDRGFLEENTSKAPKNKKSLSQCLALFQHPVTHHMSFYTVNPFAASVHCRLVATEVGVLMTEQWNNHFLSRSRIPKRNLADPSRPRPWTWCCSTEERRTTINCRRHRVDRRGFPRGLRSHPARGDPAESQDQPQPSLRDRDGELGVLRQRLSECVAVVCAALLINSQPFAHPSVSLKLSALLRKKHRITLTFNILPACLYHSRCPTVSKGLNNYHELGFSTVLSNTQEYYEPLKTYSL